MSRLEHPAGRGSTHPRFWKPGTLAPGVDIQRSANPQEDSLDGLIVYNRYAHLSLAEQRQVLPIHAVRRELLWALEECRVLILIGQTGSGKTTQVPQYLWETGWALGDRAICVCQPRQMAAVMVAERVAEELGPEHGRLVGHRTRLGSVAEDQAAQQRKILFMTDSALACETMDDPLLSKYSVIMIDEAHERSLQTDLLLGLCRKILWQRRDLRVIVSSATLDAEAFRAFFATRGGKQRVPLDVHVLGVPGRQFPVSLRYLRTPVNDYVQATVETVLHIHRSHLSGRQQQQQQQRSERHTAAVPPGHILCFMTSPEDIQAVCQALADLSDRLPGLEVWPLHSKLPPHDQFQALRPLGHQERRRGGFKCIVSTNLAETSLTIQGVSFVVDAGFVKLVSYDPQTSISTLQTAVISRQNAVQRAGRAGRETPGLCYRLYTEEAFWSVLPERTVPEICRTQLAGLVLQLKALGVDDIVQFEFCQPPPRELLAEALELCYALGCLDAEARLTSPMGRVVAEFMGLSGITESPHLAKLLWSAGQPGFHCSDEISTIAAVLTVKSVFNTPKGGQTRADACKLVYAVEQGDHLTLLNVFNGFVAAGQDPNWCAARYLNFKALRRAVQVRRTLRGYMRRLDIPVLQFERVEQIQRCLVSAYFMNAAQQAPDGQTWSTPRGQRGLRLHPSSVLVGMTPKSVTSWTSAATSVTLKPRWVVFHELIHTSQTFIRDCTMIEPEWLTELAPNYFDHRPVARGPPAAEEDLHPPPAKQPRLQQPVAEVPQGEGNELPDSGKIVFRSRKHRKLF